MMDVPGRMIRVQNESFDLCRAKMEHARFMMVDPNNGMVVMLAHNISPFVVIFRTGGPVNAHLLDKRTNVSSDVVSLPSAQCEIWHFWMRVQQEERNFLWAEVRHPSDHRERWNVGAGLTLIGGNQMATGTPTTGQLLTMVDGERRASRLVATTQGRCLVISD